MVAAVGGGMRHVGDGPSFNERTGLPWPIRTRRNDPRISLDPSCRVSDLCQTKIDPQQIESGTTTPSQGTKSSGHGDHKRRPLYNISSSARLDFYRLDFMKNAFIRFFCSLSPAIILDINIYRPEITTTTTTTTTD